MSNALDLGIYRHRDLNARWTVDTAPSGSSYTPSSEVARHGILEFDFALTQDLTVYLPPIHGRWTIENHTTGPFSLTVTTDEPAVQTTGGVRIPQGQSLEVYSDGDDIRAVSSDLPLATGGADPNALQEIVNPLGLPMQVGFVLANPHVGTTVDEMTVRAVVNGKLYFSSHRSQGAATANGYEYTYSAGTVTEIASVSGIAAWRAVYDASLDRIYAVGQAWNATGHYENIGIAINTAADTAGLVRQNVAGHRTDECNELFALLDMGDYLLAGEVAHGGAVYPGPALGTSAASDYPNAGGLWRIPKSTFLTNTTHSRVYEDVGSGSGVDAVGPYEWRNLCYYHGRVYGFLDAWGRGKCKVLSADPSDLTAWTVEVDETAQWLANDVRGSMCVCTARNLLCVVNADAPAGTNLIKLRTFDGTSWISYNTGIVVSGSGIWPQSLFAIGPRLFLISGNHTTVADGQHWINEIDPLSGAARVVCGPIRGSVDNNQIVFSGNSAYYATNEPGTIVRLGATENHAGVVTFQSYIDLRVLEDHPSAPAAGYEREYILLADGKHYRQKSDGTKVPLN